MLDEPMADASIIPTYLLSQFTREQVTVALGGDGGDELFAGYPTYLAHKVATRYEGLLKALLPGITFLGNLLPVSDDNISFDFKVKKFVSGIGFPDGIRNYVWLGSFSPSDLPRVLSSEIGNQFDITRIVEEISYYTREFPSQDRISVLQYLDLRLYLQEAILVKVDRASMANSLEVRAPLLDHELVEFVMGLPSDFKLKGIYVKISSQKGRGSISPQGDHSTKKKGIWGSHSKMGQGALKRNVCGIACL